MPYKPTSHFVRSSVARPSGQGKARPGRGFLRSSGERGEDIKRSVFEVCRHFEQKMFVVVYAVYFVIYASLVIKRGCYLKTELNL